MNRQVESSRYERMWAGYSRLGSIVALTHPTAVLLFSGLVVLLAFLAQGGFPGAKALVLLPLAMACAQAAIGLFNEVCDYDIDQISKPWRALPAGQISLNGAKHLAIGFSLVGCVLAAFLSVSSLVLLALGIGTGFLYSRRLKRTVWSWLPYVIAYPLPVIWVWVSLNKFEPSLLMLYPIALAFVVAVHFCNQLRDFDQDQALGINGTVQYLGKARAQQLCSVLLWFSPIPLLVIGLTRGMDALLLLPLVMVYWWMIPRSIQTATFMSDEMFRNVFKRLQFGGPLLLLGWFIATRW